MHCTFWFCFSSLLTARSTAPTNESRLPSPKIIRPRLLSSLDSCNIAFVALQAHCHVTHCFRNVNPWWSIILILSGDISLNPGPSVRNIKACLLNARSLRNKTSAFSDFVWSNDLDMVGVTETWLRPSDTQGLIDEITPAGFQLHHVPRRNKKGGGVAVLSGMTLIACFIKLISGTLLNTLPSNCQSDSQASSWYTSSTDLRTPVKANLLRNSTVSWKRLCHHMKTLSWEMSISS